MPEIPLQVHQSVFIPSCEAQKAYWICGSERAAEYVVSPAERHSGASSRGMGAYAPEAPRHAGASSFGQI